MNLDEIAFRPIIGKMYTIATDGVNPGDYVGTDVCILGFRTGQVKVASFDPDDVDNLDFTGRYAVVFDPKSERDPTLDEQKYVDKVLAIIAKLPPEKQ